MNQMIVTPPALPVSVAFTGERGEFRRLVTRGALLELVTVGFYRFWLAKTSGAIYGRIPASMATPSNIPDGLRNC